jgi:hypothetical protein
MEQQSALIDVKSRWVDDARPKTIEQTRTETPADHLNALVAAFCKSPESTRDTVAMLVASAIRNPATLPDCVHAIEALVIYSAAKGGPPVESKQFQPPTPNAVTQNHATEPDTHHPGT